MVSQLGQQLFPHAVAHCMEIGFELNRISNNRNSYEKMKREGRGAIGKMLTISCRLLVSKYSIGVP